MGRGAEYTRTIGFCALFQGTSSAVANGRGLHAPPTYQVPHSAPAHGGQDRSMPRVDSRAENIRPGGRKEGGLRCLEHQTHEELGLCIWPSSFCTPGYIRFVYKGTIHWDVVML